MVFPSGKSLGSDDVDLLKTAKAKGWDLLTKAVSGKAGRIGVLVQWNPDDDGPDDGDPGGLRL